MVDKFVQYRSTKRKERTRIFMLYSYYFHVVFIVISGSSCVALFRRQKRLRETNAGLKKTIKQAKLWMEMAVIMSSLDVVCQ